MSSADLFIVLLMIAFPVVVAFYAKPNKSFILFLIAGSVFLASLGSVVNGRGAALLALIVSIVFLISLLVSKFRGNQPQKQPLSGSVFCILSAIALLPILTIASKISFPELEGTYPVGVRSAEVFDNERGNAWNAIDDGPRRILVRVWYPAGSIPEETPNSRATDTEQEFAKAFGPEGFQPQKIFSETLAKTKTNAYWGVSPAEGSYPLLIFSHGYTGAVNDNAMLMEQLASQGYIVVSMTHPGEGATFAYPNGDISSTDPKTTSLLEEVMEMDVWSIFASDVATRMDFVVHTIEPGTMVSERFAVWVDDFRSVHDALLRGDLKGDIDDVLASINWQKVGYFGMSAGAAAAPAACYRDERCQATVAMDVISGLREMRNRHIQKPMMIFDSGSPYRIGGQDLYYEQHQDVGLDPHIYRLDFPHNGHFDFTDNALALTSLGKKIIPAVLPFLGPVDGAETLLTQSRLITEFFDIYLKEQPAEDFPHMLLNNTGVAELTDLQPFREWVSSQNTTKAN